MLNVRQKLYLKMMNRRADAGREQSFPGGRKRLDKPVYIIRRSGRSLGLFSYVETNLARIVYAVEHDMIPVIDMRHFANRLKENEAENPWDTYFEQPGGLSLEEAYKARDIILSDSGVPRDRPGDSMGFLTGSTGTLGKWRTAAKQYIRLDQDTQRYVDLRYKTLVEGKGKVLGVLARGTDYAKLKPSKHPVQPSGEEILLKTKEVLAERGYDRVFLATEDSEILKLFREELGEKLIAADDGCLEYKDGFLSETQNTQTKTKKQINLDYLTNIFILSRCDAIVAGRTSGTVGAALLTEGWEYEYYFDLGVYE